MKKLLSIAALAALLGTSAQADFLRVDAGAGIWNQELDGDLQYTGLPEFSTDILGYDKESKMYVWAYLKHPVPVLPNVRLEYTPIEFSGTATSDFDFAGETFTASAKSTLTMDQYDVILYYNLLDNTFWATLDVGLDAKFMDLTFKASEGATSIDESESVVLPMAYGRVRAEIPMTDIGIEADVKYVSYKDSSITDYRVKADYLLVDILPVDIGLEVGYRAQSVEIDGGDFSSDTNGKLDISGVYVGAMVRF